MKRVTGIAGFFFSAGAPLALRAWVRRHLGLDVQDGAARCSPGGQPGNPTQGTTSGSVGAADGGHCGTGAPGFVINDRVEDLAALLQLPREEGCAMLDQSEDPAFGTFGWVIDPAGNTVELWQPAESR